MVMTSYKEIIIEVTDEIVMVTARIVNMSH